MEFLQADGSEGEKLDIQIREKVKGNPLEYTFAMQMEGIISPLMIPTDKENDVSVGHPFFDCTCSLKIYLCLCILSNGICICTVDSKLREREKQYICVIF